VTGARGCRASMETIHRALYGADPQAGAAIEHAREERRAA
jgi:hypothetical protein